MQPNFNLSEAQQMLALAYVADLLGPRKNPDGKGTVTTPPANEKSNPLPNDNGTTYPYPVSPIWPAGWTPAVPVLDPYLFNVWHNSIVQAAPFGLPPILADLSVGANNVIITYNETLDAYAIAFAGTENLLGVMEDIAMIPVSAGPLNFPLYQSDTTYIVNPSYYNQPGAVPPVVEPSMHFGFRLAVEGYTVKAQTGARNNLVEAIQSFGKSEIDLYITGHSLGAAMAGVFSAWLQANPIEGITINQKVYTFAPPKFANDVLGSNYDNGLTKNGYSFRIVNNLDTVPQIPPTIEWLNDLNNPSMIEALIPKAAPSNSLTASFTADTLQKIKAIFGDLHLPKLNFNYVAIGNNVPAFGTFPVVYNQDSFPSSFFPNGEATPTTLTQMQKEWWQHWPPVYYEALNAGESATSN